MAGPRGPAPGCGLESNGRFPMKAAKMLLGVALVFGLVLIARADDKGAEKTIKGTITCAKCDLKLQKTCHTVIKSGETVYYFDTASNKKYHKKICQTPMEGSVTGTVTEKDGKKIIKAEKVNFKE
jgi:hypothetical protein